MEEKENKNFLKDNYKILGTVFVFFVIVYFSIFSGGEKNENKKLDKVVTQNVVVDNEKKIDAKNLSQTKEENAFLLLKNLEKKVEQLEQVQKPLTMLSKELIDKRNKSLNQLSKILFNKTVILEDESEMSFINDKLTQKTIEGITTTIEDVIPILIEDGYYVKIESQNLDYIITKYDGKISAIYEISVDGFQKIINPLKRDNILEILNKKSTNLENIIYKEYNKKIILFSAINSQIINELNFKSIKEGYREILKYKDIKREVKLTGFVLNDFSTIRLSNDFSVIQDGVIFPDGKYTIEYIEYYDENQRRVLPKILLKRNNYIYKEYDTKDVNSLFLLNYRNVNNKEYVYKNESIYEIEPIKQELQYINKGIIKGFIDSQSYMLEKIEIILEKKTINQTELTEYVGMLLVGEKESYTIQKDETKTPTKKYDTKRLKIDNSGFLYYENAFIDKISEIQKIGQTGVEIYTDNYIVKMLKKDMYQVYDNISKKRIFENYTLEPKLDYKKDEITVLGKEKIDLDRENNIVNGLKYRNVEDKSDTLIFYDPQGKIIIEMSKNNKLLFNEKIKEVKIIEGEGFDYNFSINQKTGEVNSDEIGKLILKYTDQNIPFSVFQKKTTQQILSTFKEKKDYLDNVLSIEKLFDINNYLKYIEFKTTENKKIKINSFQTINIDGKNFNSTNVYFHVDKKIIELNIDPKKYNSNDLKSLGMNTNETDVTQIFYNIDTITNTEKNYYDFKNEYMIFEIGNNQPKIIKYKNKDKEFVYGIIFEEIIDLKSNEVEIITKEGVNIKLNLNNLKPINQHMLNFLVEQYNSQPIKKIEIEKDILENLNDDEKKLVMAYQILNKKIKELNDFEKTKKALKIDPISLEYLMSTEQEEALKKENEEKRMFTFEIGTKLEYEITELIKVVVGTTTKTTAKLKNTFFKDMEGNELYLKDAKLIIETSENVSLAQVYPKPIKIQFLDEDTNKKVTIDIPTSATKIEYKENERDDFHIDGVPAFVVIQKMRNLGTKITMGTISEIIKQMTETTEDSMSNMMDAMSGATTTNENLNVANAASTAAGTAFEEILKVVEESESSKKDFLVIESGIKLKAVFIEEVPVELPILGEE